MKGLGADQPYWQALMEGELVMQRCDRCATWHWPAVWRCGDCGSWEHSWHPRELKGSIYSWTRTWHNFGAPKELQPPFVSVVVTLDDTGERRLMGVLTPDSEQIRIGARVSGQIHRVHLEDVELPALQWTLTEAHNSGDTA